MFVSVARSLEVVGHHQVKALALSSHPAVVERVKQFKKYRRSTQRRPHQARASNSSAARFLEPRVVGLIASQGCWLWATHSGEFLQYRFRAVGWPYIRQFGFHGGGRSRGHAVCLLMLV